MIIQIYAFTQIDQAIEAAQIGVDHIGIIAGQYGIVNGELSFKQAYRLIHSLPEEVRSVALTMATDLNEILRMAFTVEPDIIHLSTDPMAVDLKTMEQLKKRLPGSIKVMKAIPVVDETSIKMAKSFSDVCDFILLDTKLQGFPGVGATGKTHDWRISRQIVDFVPIPVILAGGLTPENVTKAIQVVQPAGVDSNTGTNLPGSPLEKDMQRIRDFVASARRSTKAEEMER